MNFYSYLHEDIINVIYSSFLQFGSNIINETYEFKYLLEMFNSDVEIELVEDKKYMKVYKVKDVDIIVQIVNLDQYGIENGWGIGFYDDDSNNYDLFSPTGKFKKYPGKIFAGLIKITEDFLDKNKSKIKYFKYDTNSDKLANIYKKIMNMIDKKFKWLELHKEVNNWKNIVFVNKDFK